MAEPAMTREQWLEFELRLDGEALGHSSTGQESDETVAELARLHRDVAAKEAELAVVRGGQRFAIRLSGGTIQGQDAPVSVVRTMVSRFAEVADEFDAEALVSPSLAGSHVIVFRGPAQMELVDSPTFVEAAEALMTLAPQTFPVGGAPEAVIRERAAGYSTKALKALHSMVSTLATNRINANLELSAAGRSGVVTISESFAAYLDLQLGQIDRSSAEVVVRGELRGFTEGSGRFEIFDGTQMITGRVPKSRRQAGAGIPLRAEVMARIEVVTTTLAGGIEREYRRLLSIERVDSI